MINPMKFTSFTIYEGIMVNTIPGFENCNDYSITENGDVYSYKNINGIPKRKLKGYPNTKGYLLVDLGKKRRAVKIHRIVAAAFIPNPDNKPQVNHINGKKQDNDYHNLEWNTNSENQKHAYLLGLNKSHKDETNYQYLGNHPNCKPVKQLDLNGDLIKIHKSAAIAGRSIGKKYNHITEVCNNISRYKTAYGFKWEFV